MANLAATDITVTFLNRRRVNGRTCNNVQLAFGDGALTYPAGGVPVDKGKLGCPNVIESLTVYDSGTSGYRWTYDRANEKLVAVQTDAASAHTHTGPSHSHDLLIKGGQAAAGTAAVAHYATDILGKEAATDATITAAAAATKGGVQAGGTGNTGSGGAVSAAPLAQPSTVAIAAQTLRCEVVGW
jgi:hypothetical protein